MTVSDLNGTGAMSSLNASGNVCAWLSVTDGAVLLSVMTCDGSHLSAIEAHTAGCLSGIVSVKI